MDFRFTPQKGWNHFESIPDKKLINLLENQRYKNAKKYINDHPNCLNNPDNYGWTPFMILISNINDNKSYDFVVHVIELGIVNIHQKTFDIK